MVIQPSSKFRNAPLESKRMDLDEPWETARVTAAFHAAFEGYDPCFQTVKV